MRDVIAFMDGIYLSNASDMNLKAMDDNGYHHDTMCNDVFCFIPTGEIIYSVINYPGSFHDDYQLVTCLVNLSQKTRDNLAPAMRQMLLQRHNLYVCDKVVNGYESIAGHI